jgi:general stress protein 26
MNTDTEMEAKFWKSLADDRTTMLGLDNGPDGHSQPMTAQILHAEGERGPIWFFSAKDTDLVLSLGRSPGAQPASLHFSSKGHELFASVQGELSRDNDRTTIDRLWNRFVAAWFPGGKDDPKLQLLRFEPASAQIWLNENSMLAGVKLLLGADPKREFRDKVAEVRLDRN